MSRIFHRLLIAVLAFVLGVSVAWFTGLVTKVEMLLAKAYPNLVFSTAGRGCGCGWTQDYTLLDGRFLSEFNSGRCYETPEAAREGIQSLITESSKVVTHVKNSTNRYGNDGERIELLYLDESGNERAKILWYDGNTHYFEIDAPELEVAHGFEEADIK